MCRSVVDSSGVRVDKVIGKKCVLSSLWSAVKGAADLAWVSRIEGIPCYIPVRLNNEFLCDMVAANDGDMEIDKPCKEEVVEYFENEFVGWEVDVHMREFEWDEDGNFYMIVAFSWGQESKAAMLIASRKRNERKRMVNTF